MMETRMQSRCSLPPCGVPMYDVGTRILHVESNGMVYLSKIDPQNPHGVIFLKCHLANIEWMDVNGFYRILRRYNYKVHLRVIKKDVDPASEIPLDEVLLFTWSNGDEKIINELIVHVDDCATNTINTIYPGMEQATNKDFHKWTNEEKKTLVNPPIMGKVENVSQSGFDQRKNITIID